MISIFSESSYQKVEKQHRPTVQNFPTQIVTDACFIYRRELIKPTTTDAMILRGREIAYEAANSPSLPSSMRNYTQDQIRELYGDLNTKTRCLQEKEYNLRTPLIDAWQEKSSSLDSCPLPKFRIEKDHQTLLMAAYLSTGLSNPRTISKSSDTDVIRGSFRTSIADRTSMTPSPLLLNVQMELNKLCSTPEILPSRAKTCELIDMDSLIDLDQETTIPYDTAEVKTDQSSTPTPIEENSSVDNLIRIVRDIREFIYVYDEKDDFEELYQRYMTNFDQYESMMLQFDDLQQKQDLLTPINEEPIPLIEKKISPDECCLTFTVQRQSNHIGHYGFELEQTLDRKIRILTISDSDYCPNLHVGDEILEINNHSIFKTLEQCHLLFHSLWYKQYHDIQLTVKRPKIPSKYSFSIR